MSRSYRLLPLFLVLLLTLACSEAPVSPDRPGPPDPSPDIVDAGHGTEAPGFYFLPPMTDDPSATGTFDDGLAPVVTICEGTVTECPSPVAEFTTTSGPDSETVRMVAEDEHYIVNWHTDAFDLDPELTYRIVVSVLPSGASEALVLGYADVAVASTGGELKNTDTGEEVALKDGRTLPIKFRIETGIVGRVVIEPSQAEIEVGDTQSFTATLYDLHGSELTSPAVSWSSNDESVATVDASGLATGVSSGIAAITATSQRVSDSAELTLTTAGLSPTQVAKILASDGAARNHFGSSVSVSGDVAVIGASGDDDNGSSSGSAYVFERSGGSWTQAAKLTAGDGAEGDGFGFTVSVSVSGDVAVIGAFGDDDNGSASGSAYVFERSGGSWTQAAKLTPSDGAAFDLFGRSVSVSGDVAVIGANQDDDNGSASGSAYVFERSGGSWTQAAKLTSSDGVVGDGFGRSVAVDGDVAVIGAFGDNDNGRDSGSAYVFERSGGSWTQAAKLTADDGAANDQFGRSVSVSGDVAVIGSFLDDDNGSSSGSAYGFERSGGSWTQVAKLLADDGAAEDNFGILVSVSGDVAVIGAPGDVSNSGSAYVFERSGGSWTQAAKLTSSDGAAFDQFGRSVSVSGDVAVIGALRDDDNGSSSGSAYVFNLQP